MKKVDEGRINLRSFFVETIRKDDLCEVLMRNAARSSFDSAVLKDKKYARLKSGVKGMAEAFRTLLKRVLNSLIDGDKRTLKVLLYVSEQRRN